LGLLLLLAIMFLCLRHQRALRQEKHAQLRQYHQQQQQQQQQRQQHQHGAEAIEMVVMGTPPALTDPSNTTISPPLPPATPSATSNVLYQHKGVVYNIPSLPSTTLHVKRSKNPMYKPFIPLNSTGLGLAAAGGGGSIDGGGGSGHTSNGGGAPAYGGVVYTADPPPPPAAATDPNDDGTANTVYNVGVPARRRTGSTHSTTSAASYHDASYYDSKGGAVNTTGAGGAVKATMYAVPMEDAPTAITIVQVYGSAEDNVDGAVVVAPPSTGHPPLPAHAVPTKKTVRRHKKGKDLLAPAGAGKDKSSSSGSSGSGGSGGSGGSTPAPTLGQSTLPVYSTYCSHPTGDATPQYDLATEGTAHNQNSSNTRAGAGGGGGVHAGGTLQYYDLATDGCQDGAAAVDPRYAGYTAPETANTSISLTERHYESVPDFAPDSEA
jgi:hypothetical protein